MCKFVIDVEADGPCPGLYSMISFGAIRINSKGEPEDIFEARLRPVSDDWIPDALAVSGHTRDETLQFEDPKDVMIRFEAWINESNINHRPMFFSDNNGFDWQFINYYFHKYCGNNPFGHSSTNISNLYKGWANNMKSNHKRLRKTKHTHNPIDDAMGNVEALVAMRRMGFNITF